jgi:hypothetical protein
MVVHVMKEYDMFVVDKTFSSVAHGGMSQLLKLASPNNKWG